MAEVEEHRCPFHYRLVPLKNRGVYSVGIHSCSATLCGTVKHNEEAGGMSTKLQSQKILQGDVEIELFC